ncbi:DUF72 domain-containing protein [Candidatus Latescibacterota bacterium]
MMAVGTSGYSYRDWKGVFYPETLKTEEYLSYYAEHFPAVEINSTYYGIPKLGTFERMVERTPEGFEFIIKANSATTHELSDRTVNRAFQDALAPLVGAGRLKGVLVQFPWRFRNEEANRRYLAELRESYDDTPLFIEFRHNSWNREEVYDYLSDLNLHYVSVDEPQIGDMMPPVARVTGGIGYVRFHGRNAANWWGKGGDRYDYLYSEDELTEWIDRVEQLEKSTWKLYAFFNNCHQGYAVRNALMFRELMKKQGRLV